MSPTHPVDPLDRVDPLADGRARAAPAVGRVVPGLAVVVVTYGSTPLLRRHLAVVADALPLAQVIVVDCWSSARERQDVSRLCVERGWSLVGLADNRGFGGGANAGVTAALTAGATDVLLLNPDAVIEAPDVERLRAAVAVRRLRVVAPVVLDETGAIWSSGVDLDLADGSMHGVAVDAPAVPGRRRWVSGACLLVTREVWAATGGFDEAYFLYWEDVDFSQRVIDAGGEVVVVADATAVHEEGGTQHRRGSRAKSADYYYYNIANRMRYAAAHLDAAGVRRWQRAAPRAAYDIVLRGGRRQLVQSLDPLRAAARGLRDGRRLAATSTAPPRT